MLSEDREDRKLATIMSSDMAEDSALAPRSEALALELLEEHPHSGRAFSCDGKRNR
jgi:hypothetical protein